MTPPNLPSFHSIPALASISLALAQVFVVACYGGSNDPTAEPCQKDLDCKGDRLCVDGLCQDPGTTGTTSNDVPTEPVTGPNSESGDSSDGGVPPPDSDEEEPGDEADKLPDACIEGAPGYAMMTSADFCPLPVIVLVDHSSGEAVITDEQVAQEFDHVNEYFALSSLRFKVVDIQPFETIDEFNDTLSTEHITVGFFNNLVNSKKNPVCGLAQRGTTTTTPNAKIDAGCTSAQGNNTTVHELGHVLGLPHTHGTGGEKGDAPVEELGADCYNTPPLVGDYLCDTPADPSNQYCEYSCVETCDPPYQDHKPNKKLVMSYYPDNCTTPATAFSAEQINTMRCLVDTWYGTLGICCTPDDHTVCSGGDVHWVDSCGAVGDVAETCNGDMVCVEISATTATCQDVSEDCGNGTLDPEEECDGGDFGGASCASEGLGSGSLDCNAACMIDTSGCCSANDHSECYQGDVYWFDSCGQPGDLKESCSDGCSGDTCDDPCEESYAVTGLKCPDFSSANGQGPGGGELMSVCGTIDSQSGYATIRAQKQPNDPNPIFGQRPYQVRVSSTSDDPCGPDTYFFSVSDDSPSGIGSDELAFQFQSLWNPGQTEKAYCVTASTKNGDPGYDPNSSQQESWWWSEKVVVTRTTCP